MNSKKTMKIVIVEDDRYYNRALTQYVHTICNPKNYPLFNFEISSYQSAHEFFEESDDDTNIMILDYFLINDQEADVLTGQDVVVEVKKTNPDCKIIMVTEQQDPSVATQLHNLGVAEYIDKNISNKDRLGAILQKILTDEQVKLKQ
jgi:DNA-binding NtrC family response regulator